MSVPSIFLSLYTIFDKLTKIPSKHRKCYERWRGCGKNKRIIPGHLGGFGSVKDMERFEQYCDDGFTGMTEIRDSNIPSVAECGELREELSGEVAVWEKKKPSERGPRLII